MTPDWPTPGTGGFVVGAFELFEDSAGHTLIAENYLQHEYSGDQNPDLHYVQLYALSNAAGYYIGNLRFGYHDSDSALTEEALLTFDDWRQQYSGPKAPLRPSCTLTAVLEGREVEPLQLLDTCSPIFECFLKELDADRCADFMFRFHNENSISNIDQFFIDVEAGEGGVDSTCIGSAVPGTANITPPPGWSVVNCTGWNAGHALFQFTNDDPVGNPFEPGDAVTGFITLDTNKSREFQRVTDGNQPSVTVPPFTAQMAAAQFLGNETSAVCASNDYSFGPARSLVQKWTAIHNCKAPLNVPTTSTWAKAILLALVLAGGTLLLRSRVSRVGSERI